MLVGYLVSWRYVWWCLWRFCSWSCHLHTLHSCPPAPRSRPLRHIPLSVNKGMQNLTHADLSTCAAVFPRAFPHLTLRTHADTVWVLVWAPRTIQDHCLREDCGSGLLGLTMQVAAFASWKADTNDHREWKPLSKRLSQCHPCDLTWRFHVYNRHAIIFMLWISSLWVSATLCLIVSVWVSHTTTAWAPRDEAWQIVRVWTNTPTSSHLLQMATIQRPCLLERWH